MLIRWISEKEIAGSITSSLSKKESEKVYLRLNKLISELSVNATSIKAAIRTLLRSKRSRREDLLDFIKSTLNENSNQTKAMQILKSDLMSNQKELGYPIPIMSSPKEVDINQIKKRPNAGSFLAYEAAIRKLAERLNQGDLTLRKDMFESAIKSQTEAAFLTNDLDKLSSALTDQINEGIRLAYLNFGLHKKANGFHLDSEKNEVIDLNNSSV